jgi:peptide/nickel transport system substrate-binding protein
MKRRFVSLFLVCCVIAVLLLNSCATQTAQTTTSPPATTTAAPTTSTPLPPAKTTPAAEVPKYGGTLIDVLTADPTMFDSGARSGGTALGGTVYEAYLTMDWTRGPAGSGITNLTTGANYVEDHLGPMLAESWQMPQVGIWKFQIRQGVRWQQTNTDAGRLMNGRAMTVDDVVSSWNRLKADPRSWGNVSQPAIMKASTIEKTGPWEVTIKTPVDPWTSFTWVVFGAGFLRQYPPEVVAKYGDVQDWHNAVGTGPFILIDFVPGSSLTFKKNPNYWGTDPVGPGKGNPLPYVDTYKQLVIPDLSTRLAGLRTAKIDFMSDIVLDDADNLIKANPDMKYVTYLSNNPWVIGMRRDKSDNPLSSAKVRQALMLATDFNAFRNDLFKGQGDIDVYPVNKQVASLYQPLSEMPQAVQDLFKYNPDKAKQLLKDAGYPNGFKTSVITVNTAERVDELSIFKGMWAKVGIDLTIDSRESGVYTSIANARSHENMIYRSPFQTFSIQLFLSGLRGSSTFNGSYVNDPIGSDPFIEERYSRLQQNIFVDNPAAYKAYRELKPYVLENVFYLPRPTPNTYVLWWPWLKNYYGQGTPTMMPFGLAKFFWIDVALKQQMGH